MAITKHAWAKLKARIKNSISKSNADAILPPSPSSASSNAAASPPSSNVASASTKGTRDTMDIESPIYACSDADASPPSSTLASASAKEDLVTVDLESPIVVSDDLLAFIDRSFEVSSFELFQATVAKRSFTLCHGDFHADNIYVDLSSHLDPLSTSSTSSFFDDDVSHLINNNFVKRVQPSDNVILDWSDFGPFEPSFDISLLFLLNGPMQDNNVEGSEAVARDMVAAFHQAMMTAAQDRSGDALSSDLPAHIMTKYPLDHCFRMFCRSSIERMIPLMSMAVLSPRFGNPLFQYFFNRIQYFYTHFFLKYAEGEKSFFVARPVAFT
jgi:hypothetical protein